MNLMVCIRCVEWFIPEEKKMRKAEETQCGQEPSVIKGVFTFSSGAKLPRAKMSRSKGAELENHTFCWFSADVMLRFTLPFTPGESQSKLHHYTSISSPFIISHCRRSPKRKKIKIKKSGLFSKHLLRVDFCLTRLPSIHSVRLRLCWWVLCSSTWLCDTCISTRIPSTAGGRL